eukprot:6111724-Prymnesium_polylepis.1
MSSKGASPNISHMPSSLSGELREHRSGPSDPRLGGVGRRVRRSAAHRSRLLFHHHHQCRFGCGWAV